MYTHGGLRFTALFEILAQSKISTRSFLHNMRIHTGDLGSRPYSKYLCRFKSVHGAFCMCIHTGDLGLRPYSKYLRRVKSVHGAFCINMRIHTGDLGSRPYSKYLCRVKSDSAEVSGRAQNLVRDGHLSMW